MSDTSLRNMRKRGLGRGLSALFDDGEEGAALENDTTAVPAGRRQIGIDQLEPGIYQPRRDMDDDALAELAASIAVHGVLQPILVRPISGAADRYEIIAGERRWRASQKAQLHEVPVIIKDFDDKTTLEVALIENLQREDLNAVEEALGYRRLMDEFGHTQEKLAAGLGKSRSHIANSVRLLSLPEPVLAHIRQGRLSAGHARALVTAENPESLAEQIIANGLNVRETERLMADHSGRPARQAATPKPAKDVDTLALEKEMSDMLGMRVSVDMRSRASGTLKIDFASLDQLDDALQRLTGARR